MHPGAERIKRIHTDLRKECESNSPVQRMFSCHWDADDDHVDPQDRHDMLHLSGVLLET